MFSFELCVLFVVYFVVTARCCCASISSLIFLLILATRNNDSLLGLKIERLAQLPAATIIFIEGCQMIKYSFQLVGRLQIVIFSLKSNFKNQILQNFGIFCNLSNQLCKLCRFLILLSPIFFFRKICETVKRCDSQCQNSFDIYLIWPLFILTIQSN